MARTGAACLRTRCGADPPGCWRASATTRSGSSAAARTAGSTVRGRAEDLAGRLGQPRRVQRLAGVLAGGDRPSHHLIGRAVVEAATEDQRLGQVGRAGEPRGRRRAQRIGADLEGPHDLGPQRDHAGSQLHGTGGLPVGVQPVVGPRPGGPLGGQRAGDPTDEGAGPAADDGQGVRVALLRHEHRRPAQRRVELDVPERRAGEDLQVLGQPVDGDGGLGRGGDTVDQPVDRPHGVAGVDTDGREPQQLGQPRPVDRDAAAADTADPGGAGVGPCVAWRRRCRLRTPSSAKPPR
jgi:hypothetical protein